MYLVAVQILVAGAKTVLCATRAGVPPDPSQKPVAERQSCAPTELVDFLGIGSVLNKS